MSRYLVENAAVIGAGNMGSGIAQKIATEGIDVVLVDLDQARVDAGLERIRTTLAEGVERRIFKAEQAERILGRIRGTSDWTELGDVDLAIEAVFEEIQIKKQVFARLAEVCKPTAILATNTSSFRVAQIAESTPNPERVIGLHYFYHPAKNRLVEVIGHGGASRDALDAAWAFQEAIGKTPIASDDVPGFVVNRFFVPWLNEAVRMLEEGVADIPTIDAAAREAFAIGMGPFELLNVTGVTIGFHAATTLGEQIHPFYAPVQTLVRHADGGEDFDLSGVPDPSRFGAVADRLLAVPFLVGSALVEEGVATIEATDIGARVGLRWSQGPFQLINAAGLTRARALASALAERWDLPVPELLKGAPDDGIPITLVDRSEHGGVTRVRIDRPDALNALDPATTEQLGAAIRGSEGPRVVAGSGKAFVAGADIKFFVDNLRRERFDDIYRFTADGHDILARLGTGGPTVARVHGLSLGGGTELALACDYIVCSPKGSFGFPETGIGIIPGLGGTQRTGRRVGTPIAKYLIYSGQSVDATTALALGLCDAVVGFDRLDAECLAVLARGREGRVAPSQPRDPQWASVWSFFDRYTVAEILGGQADCGGDERLERAVKRMGQKSAVALRLAERLIDAGEDLPIAEACALELAALEEVFGHGDALEGLSALLERRRPVFAG